MDEPAHLRATRASYDAVAGPYADRGTEVLDDKPLDRALLAAFAELVLGSGRPEVLDVGCGPGYLTAHLAGLGLAASGVDLSPAMVAEARRRYPQVRVEVGRLQDLPVADGALGGVVSSFSLIHTPPEERPAVLREWFRALAPGGYLLLSFQVGEGVRHLTEWFDREVDLDAVLMSPDEVGAELAVAGFSPVARTVREPDGEVERLPRAFLLARRPPEPAGPRPQ